MRWLTLLMQVTPISCPHLVQLPPQLCGFVATAYGQVDCEGGASNSTPNSTYHQPVEVVHVSIQRELRIFNFLFVFRSAKCSHWSTDLLPMRMPDHHYQHSTSLGRRRNGVLGRTNEEACRGNQGLDRRIGCSGD